MNVPGIAGEKLPRVLGRYSSGDPGPTLIVTAGQHEVGHGLTEPMLYTPLGDRLLLRVLPLPTPAGRVHR